jgi:hypothetical protein
MNPNTTSNSAQNGSNAKSPAKKRGDNKQPKSQRYFARPSKTIKVWTETLKAFSKTGKLTGEQRGALAYFTFKSDRSD